MNKIFTLKNFENKNLLILGDSVSAQATIGNDKVYATLLKENLKLKKHYQKMMVMKDRINILKEGLIWRK